MLAYILTFIIGTSMGVLGKIKLLFIAQISISPSISTLVYKGLEKYKSTDIHHDVTGFIEFPLYSIKLIWFKYPFFLYAYQVELKTGYMAKERHLEIYCPRIFVKYVKAEIEAVVRENSKPDKVDVKMSMKGGYYLTTQSLDRENSPLYLNERTKTAITELVEEFDSGVRRKAGILFYGPPGNGKSSIVRHLALKYGYTVHIIDTGNLKNEELVYLFASHNPDKKKIVLFEDFDNTFNKRVCQNENGPTFDMILNLIDGIYVNTKNTLFCMTTNNLDRIDDALKNRRFDLTIEIDNPDESVRSQLLPPEQVRESCGMSMVQIMEKYKLACV